MAAPNSRRFRRCMSNFCVSQHVSSTTRPSFQSWKRNFYSYFVNRRVTLEAGNFLVWGLSMAEWMRKAGRWRLGPLAALLLLCAVIGTAGFSLVQWATNGLLESEARVDSETW